MTGRAYDLAELQRLDDECRAAAAGIGLDVPELVFHLSSADRIYDIAARGLPGRYPHWRFGQEYERMRLDHDHGRSRIYELVLNTQPFQAYLLEGNSWVAQLLVMAHVYGHCWFFANNAHFRRTDRKFLHRVRAGAERIERYGRSHGPAAVEDLVDAAQALAFHAPFQLVKTRSPEPPAGPEVDPFGDLFPEETDQSRQRHRAALEQWRARTPHEPEEDILGFLLNHSRHLDDWERDVLSILREEAAYFAPQRRTRIANEGFASWVHNRIVQAMQLDTAEFLEFNRLDAEVRQPHPLSINPYNVGLELWREVERAYDEPGHGAADDHPGVGQVSGQERVLELAAVCDDAALVAGFLSPEVCDRCRLFAWRRTGPTRLACTTREAEAIRSQLVGELSHVGIPRIEIVDAEAFGVGGLQLVHRHEGVGLDDEYARHTLPHLARLWGRRVCVETITVADGRNEPRWYTCAPGEEVGRAQTAAPTG